MIYYGYFGDPVTVFGKVNKRLWEGIQSTLSKTDTFGTGTSCSS